MRCFSTIYGVLAANRMLTWYGGYMTVAYLCMLCGVAAIYKTYLLRLAADRRTSLSSWVEQLAENTTCEERRGRRRGGGERGD